MLPFHFPSLLNYLRIHFDDGHLLFVTRSAVAVDLPTVWDKGERVTCLHLLLDGTVEDVVVQDQVAALDEVKLYRIQIIFSLKLRFRVNFRLD